MKKDASNCNVPADWLWHFGLFVILPCTALLGGFLLSLLNRIKTADAITLYGCGVGSGVLGVLLLLLARLPLYRRRRFWMIGPGALDPKHRRLYWLAYIASTISLLLFWIVWLRTR